jgi:hypothetical protein
MCIGVHWKEIKFKEVVDSERYSILTKERGIHHGEVTWKYMKEQMVEKD